MQRCKKPLTEPLEPKLVLKQLIQDIRVLAAVRIIDLIVRAHDAPDTGAHGVCERPQIQFMHCFIIEVAADAAAEVLLLVEHVVLDAGHHTRALRANDGFGHRHAAEIRVRPEGFEVAAAGWVAAQRADDGT